MRGTLLVLGFAVASGAGFADQKIVAAKVERPPRVDGSADDPVWAQAGEIVTRDAVAGIDISLKAVYAGDELFFLVRFPDPAENRLHRPLVWDAEQKLYRLGPEVEDTFVFKWNLEPYPVNLSLTSDQPYRADIWFWKANRTDHAGFADDKIDTYHDRAVPEAKRIISKSGRIFYLLRQGDEGEPAYLPAVYTDYVAARMPGFQLQYPTGSRADVRAKGRWKDGAWTIEFARKLTTGHSDDIEFASDQDYQFGVSRYEIAGRETDPGLEQPDYGRGDTGERLHLYFDGGTGAR